MALLGVPKVARSCTISLLLAATLIMMTLARSSEAQVIRLRHPETIENFSHWRPPLFQHGASNEASHAPFSQPNGPFKNEHPPPNIQNRRPPKAGNIIVRFDSDHEIQRLEYVMRDGRLATIYTRNHSAEGPPATNSQQRQTATSLLPLPPMSLTPPPSPLPQQQQQQQRNDQTQQAGFPTQVPNLASSSPERPEKEEGIATIDMEENEFEQADQLYDESADASETGEILATIASGIIRNGYQSNVAKLQKANGMISKIKKKFKQLPQLIGSKLRAKSSLGRIFLDHRTGSVEQFHQPAANDQSAGNLIGSMLDRQQQQQQQQPRPQLPVKTIVQQQTSKVTTQDLSPQQLVEA